ncbi:hypothetical protein HK102_005884 [Quaeritorhiza haematococci]|nr:hypothetical protein HK102_005884 [Quaeritorhiza haematococci]
MSNSNPKPKSVPPFQVNSYNEDILSPYIQVLKNWNADVCKFDRPSAPLDQLEHRFFRLFFFNVLETLPWLSTSSVIGNLKTKAKYVVDTLLSLPEDESLTGGPNSESSG